MFIKESQNEEAVKNVIKEIDAGAQASFTVPVTKFVADFYLPGRKTLIEVNGPSHYIKKFDPLQNDIKVTSELNGRSLAKERRFQ